MPDGYPKQTPEPVDEELEHQRARYVAMLERGLASLRAGHAVTPDQLDSMIEEAFAKQDAERVSKP